MRRALREQLPAFTFFYGLKPWEIEQLTFGELETYTTWMNAYVEQHQGG